ncbi:MAG: hypothetical protein EZS28_053499, partial [Streblomastix strix]
EEQRMRMLEIQRMKQLRKNRAEMQVGGIDLSYVDIGVKKTRRRKRREEKVIRENEDQQMQIKDTHAYWENLDDSSNEGTLHRHRHHHHRAHHKDKVGSQKQEEQQNQSDQIKQKTNKRKHRYRDIPPIKAQNVYKFVVRENKDPKIKVNSTSNQQVNKNINSLNTKDVGYLIPHIDNQSDLGTSQKQERKGIIQSMQVMDDVQHEMKKAASDLFDDIAEPETWSDYDRFDLESSDSKEKDPNKVIDNRETMSEGDCESEK